MRAIIRRIAPVVCLLLIAGVAANAAGQEAGTRKKLSKEEQKKYDLSLEKALVHYEKANLLYEKGKLAETAKELESIVALEFPEGTEDMDGPKLQLEMRAFLGEIYLDLDRPKDAVLVLVDGIKKAPEISDRTYQLYMTLGHALKTQDEVDAALEAFEKAEAINEELMKREKEEKEESGDSSGENKEK